MARYAVQVNLPGYASPDELYQVERELDERVVVVDRSPLSGAPPAHGSFTVDDVRSYRLTWTVESDLGESATRAYVVATTNRILRLNGTLVKFTVLAELVDTASAAAGGTVSVIGEGAGDAVAEAATGVGEGAANAAGAVSEAASNVAGAGLKGIFSNAWVVVVGGVVAAGAVAWAVWQSNKATEAVKAARG